MDGVDRFEMNPIVFIREEGVMGVVIEYGAYTSVVRYMLGGHLYEEYIDNDDFVVVDNILIRHIDMDEED